MPHSEEMIDFLLRTLQEAPGRRLTAKQLLNHSFIARRKFKAKDLQGYDMFSVVNSDFELTVWNNEKERIREKNVFFAKASKFE